MNTNGVNVENLTILLRGLFANLAFPLAYNFSHKRTYISLRR